MDLSLESLIVGDYYIVKPHVKSEAVIMKHIKTRGDMDRFPTFVIELPHSKPLMYTIPRERVLSHVKVEHESV